jgi:hypothetical protein
MTVSDILFKIKKTWWLLIILPILFFVIFLPFLSKPKYLASIGLGTNFNNPEFSNSNNYPPEYILSLKEFSSYLTARLSSPEIQGKIIKKIGLTDISINEKKSFYTVNTQSGGYTSVSWESANQNEANLFLVAIKEVYSEILSTELNKGSLAKYQVSIKKDFIENVVEMPTPKQFKILPFLAGFLVALFIITLTPKKLLQKNSQS